MWSGMSGHAQNCMVSLEKPVDYLIDLVLLEIVQNERLVHLNPRRSLR